MPALTVKLPAQLPPSCRQLPWLSHITDTELGSQQPAPVSSIKILVSRASQARHLHQH